MATDSISLTAVHPAARKVFELKRRFEKLGKKLLQDDWNECDRSSRVAPGLYVLDPKTDTILYTYPMDDSRATLRQALHDLDRYCVEWEADAREDDDAGEAKDESAAQRERPLERARDAAQVATYVISDLVRAALAINDEHDGRIEECLKAAIRNLSELAEALDTVNWPESASMNTETARPGGAA